MGHNCWNRFLNSDCVTHDTWHDVTHRDNAEDVVVTLVHPPHITHHVVRPGTMRTSQGPANNPHKSSDSPLTGAKLINPTSQDGNTKTKSFSSVVPVRVAHLSSGHMTWILAYDWSRVITWPGYWPLIGPSSSSGFISVTDPRSGGFFILVRHINT